MTKGGWAQSSRPDTFLLTSIPWTTLFLFVEKVEEKLLSPFSIPLQLRCQGHNGRARQCLPSLLDCRERKGNQEAQKCSILIFGLSKLSHCLSTAKTWEGRSNDGGGIMHYICICISSEHGEARAKKNDNFLLRGKYLRGLRHTYNIFTVSGTTSLFLSNLVFPFQQPSTCHRL